MPTQTEINRDNAYWDKVRKDRAKKIEEIKNEDDRSALLEWLYIHFRETSDSLENEYDSLDLKEKDRKRLDKSITLMKVAFKIVKKIVKRSKDHSSIMTSSYHTDMEKRH